MRFIWIMDTNVSSPWYQNLNIRSRFLIWSVMSVKNPEQIRWHWQRISGLEMCWIFLLPKKSFQRVFANQSLQEVTRKMKDEIYRIVWKTVRFRFDSDITPSRGWKMTKSPTPTDFTILSFGYFRTMCPPHLHFV